MRFYVMTGMSGRSVAMASPFAKLNPTSNEPINPGAYVTAIASMFSREHFASSKASLASGVIDSICALEAISVRLHRRFCVYRFVMKFWNSEFFFRLLQSQ